MKCPRCQRELPTEATACSACGLSFDDATQKLETAHPPSKSKPKSSSSFDSIDDARFVPGMLLAERYRIVGLVGKGGMGEVYRADDLKLAQPVALKFLPEHLLSDEAALTRFHREVRVARQVSHKNVCRVYDIGEVDSRHFLSMEFIKGEELSSLMRRIGRLPQDKAIQIARQMCAGLAAAHEAGVLHRDLKPSNIMIDEHGNARITDFGLAGLAEEFLEDEKHAGTPAYMAPEQLEGQTFTVRSDIYAVGLVLYELFTGKRAFDAATLGELVKLRRSDTSPTTPSEIVKDLDPAIERVIDRCLQKNPALRPSSALQVSAALPGGDPIAAALAAGETPSPEMVAAAPKEGALRPAIALSLFASLMVTLALVVFLADQRLLHNYVPLEKPPEVLKENARAILRQAQVSAAATDYMHDFDADHVALEYLARTDPRPGRWQDLKDGQPAAVLYWYRQSPSYLAGFNHFQSSWTNPPPTITGMSGVKLDARGRLLEFYAVPSQVDPVPSSEFRASTSEQVSSSALPGSASARARAQSDNRNSKFETRTFDWSVMFRAAGFDIGNFKPTASQWAPLYQSDNRLAWEGVYPEQATIPIRIEAASYQGKPVYFEVVNPWTRPERQDPLPLSRTRKALFTIMVSVFVLVLIGSLLLAIRNLRLGRGDRKGAMRVAIFVFALTLISLLVSAHHVPTFAEFGVVLNCLNIAVFVSGFFWVVYVALEPFVRRRWPHRIISWTRLLAGDFRDPLVGRDLLIGMSFGVGMLLWQLILFILYGRLTGNIPKPGFEPGSTNLGLANFVEAFGSQLSAPLIFGLQYVVFVLLLALLFRRDRLACVIGGIVFTAGLSFLWGGSLFNWLSASVTSALIVIAFYRYGLLTLLASIFSVHLYVQLPMTANITSWYAAGFLLALIIFVAMAVLAFRVSLAGQQLLRGRFLEEN
jgi:serine/threonine-protein kinase